MIGSTRTALTALALFGAVTAVGTDAYGEPPATDARSAQRDARSVAEIQRSLEQTLQAMGELAAESREESDIVRADCIRQKNARAEETMELATNEILVIRDSGTSEQARAFAIEKLQAADERLSTLATEARACSGVLEPEDEDGVTSNDQDEANPVPVADPTTPPFLRPTLPPLDPDTRPPVVASPTL